MLHSAGEQWYRRPEFRSMNQVLKLLIDQIDTPTGEMLIVAD